MVMDMWMLVEILDGVYWYVFGMVSDFVGSVG